MVIAKNSCYSLQQQQVFTLGVWIPAWGEVSALLWDHYSDGYK